MEEHMQSNLHGLFSLDFPEKSGYSEILILIQLKVKYNSWEVFRQSSSLATE
jgi:hypothetical protein